MLLKKSVLNQAIKITSAYEGSGFGALTGNFDGQFMSYGFIQWCFGQGTLQPLFKRLFKEFPGVAARVLPEGGKSLRAALLNNSEKDWALQRQEGNKFIDPWKTALKKLGETSEMQKIQMDAAKWYIDRAVNQMGQFGLYTDRSFCLLFDIAVQNGGSPYVTFTPEMSYFDKLKNIVDATVIKSNIKWQGIVRDRKMAIVNSHGSVYGEPFSYTFYDAGAFYDEVMGKALDALVSKGVINSKSYWMEYADGNIPCKGDFCGSLITKATETSALAEGVDVLVQKNLTNSPDYWRQNAVEGKVIVGQNAKSLIYRLQSI
jgi:hypothetical protein